MAHNNGSSLWSRTTATIARFVSGTLSKWTKWDKKNISFSFRREPDMNEPSTGRTNLKPNGKQSPSRQAWSFRSYSTGLSLVRHLEGQKKYEGHGHVLRQYQHRPVHSIHLTEEQTGRRRDREINPWPNLHGTILSSVLPEERETKLLNCSLNVPSLWVVLSLLRVQLSPEVSGSCIHLVCPCELPSDHVHSLFSLSLSFVLIFVYCSPGVILWTVCGDTRLIVKQTIVTDFSCWLFLPSSFAFTSFISLSLPRAESQQSLITQQSIFFQEGWVSWKDSYPRLVATFFKGLTSQSVDRFIHSYGCSTSSILSMTVTCLITSVCEGNFVLKAFLSLNRRTKNIWKSLDRVGLLSLRGCWLCVFPVGSLSRFAWIMLFCLCRLQKKW